MSLSLEEKIEKMPIFNLFVKGCKRIILPGFEGLSFYDLLKSYIKGIVYGTFSARAGAIAFSFFMAIFPFLLFVLNLIPYIKVKNFNEKFLTFIQEAIPEQSFSFFQPIIEDIVNNPRSGLLSFVLILSIFLMANGVNTIFSSFEYSFHTSINRHFIKQYFYALGISMFMVVVLLVTVVVIIYGEVLIVNIKNSGLNLDDVFWISGLRNLFFVFMIYTNITTLYHFGTKEGKESRFFSVGAIITTLLFILTTYLFGIYIDNFSNYNELYGSIGALLILMLYIWLNSNLLLLGYELNATLNILKSKYKGKNEKSV